MVQFDEFQNMSFNELEVSDQEKVRATRRTRKKSGAHQDQDAGEKKEKQTNEDKENLDTEYNFAGKMAVELLQSMTSSARSHNLLFVPVLTGFAEDVVVKSLSLSDFGFEPVCLSPLPPESDHKALEGFVRPEHANSLQYKVALSCCGLVPRFIDTFREAYQTTRPNKNFHQFFRDVLTNVRPQTHTHHDKTLTRNNLQRLGLGLVLLT